MEDIEERDVMDMEASDELMDDIQELGASHTMPPLLMKRTKSNNLSHRNFEEEKIAEPNLSQTCKSNLPMFRGLGPIGSKNFSKAFDYKD